MTWTQPNLFHLLTKFAKLIPPPLHPLQKTLQNFAQQDYGGRGDSSTPFPFHFYFLDTARPRDTRILVPEKNSAAQNRTS